MLVCIECALRAVVEGKDPPRFNESPEEHMRRVHPDGGAQGADRAKLERAAMEAIQRRIIGGKNNGK
jgi:hypothetical protein